MTEDLKKDELSELAEFFKKKENQEAVLQICMQMRSVFGRDLFTFNQLKRVFPKDSTEKLVYIIRVLYLCKFLKVKSIRGVERYRVSMAEIEKIFNKIKEEEANVVK